MNNFAKQRSDPLDEDEVPKRRHSANMNASMEYNLNRHHGDDRYNIVRICLTGGPCAGKTTAIASIKQELT